ncbi:Hypothetical predicted protein [Paramuricea clavata]|uniref:Uncharacterized protein n=1 Tax=Paramuricea clavata TaxID=317549 RepID=A0A6S7IPT0_PARCT|nr:Hypothetical predicted protein [Paramuricea clavata]
MQTSAATTCTQKPFQSIRLPMYTAPSTCVNKETFQWLLKFLETRENFLPQPCHEYVFTSTTGWSATSSQISAFFNSAWLKSGVLDESQPKLNATRLCKALVTIQREMMPGEEDNLATAMAHSRRVQDTHYNVRKTRQQVLQVSKKYNDLLDEVSECEPTESEPTESESITTSQQVLQEMDRKNVFSRRRLYTAEEEEHICQAFADEIAGKASLKLKTAKMRLRNWKSLRDLTSDQIVNKVKSLRKLRVKKLKNHGRQLTPEVSTAGSLELEEEQTFKTTAKTTKAVEELQMVTDEAG